MKVMSNLQDLKLKVQNFFSFMNPFTWMGVGAFALGFLIGSEGDLAGTVFYPVFWLVGIWMYTKISEALK
jgi:hypothetical protein